MIQLISVKIGNSTLDVSGSNLNVPNDQPIQVTFNNAVDTSFINKAISLQDTNGTAVAFTYSAVTDATAFIITPTALLQYSTDYTLDISSALTGKEGEMFPGVQYKFTTVAGLMVIDSISLNGKIMSTSPLQDIDPDNIKIKVTFSKPLDPASYKSSISYSGAPLS